MSWTRRSLPTSSRRQRRTTGGPAARRRNGKAMREQLARAYDLPEFWLDMDPEGEGLPVELTPLAIARALNSSPEAIRQWPEDDVLDQLTWMEIEGLVQRKQAKEMERARARR